MVKNMADALKYEFLVINKVSPVKFRYDVPIKEVDCVKYLASCNRF